MQSGLKLLGAKVKREERDNKIQYVDFCKTLVSKSQLLNLSPDLETTSMKDAVWCIVQQCHQVTHSSEGN